MLGVCRESSCWVCVGSLHAGCGEGVFMLGVERESSCWVWRGSLHAGCVERVFMLGVGEGVFMLGV